jgi:hypothetical protein
MNPWVQRYAPPALVLCAAIYLGWPPPEPLDLGEDVVRATSVRWRPQDLSLGPRIESSRDPFEETPVEVEQVEVAVEVLEPTVPAGPDADTLKAGFHLDGIANMGGRTWAVLNGRPRLEGDFVRTDDTHRHRCQIVSVAPDHITIRYEETIVEIRPGAARERNSPSSRSPSNRSPSNRSPSKGSPSGHSPSGRRGGASPATAGDDEPTTAEPRVRGARSGPAAGARS